MRVDSGPDAKADAVEIKCLHSPSQQVFHRKVDLPRATAIANDSGNIMLIADLIVISGVFKG